jgi:hypothetical protein
MGAMCTVSIEYMNPYSGSMGLMKIHEFTLDKREYKVTKRVDLPYTCKYSLMVNYRDDWEIRITQ